MQKKLRRISLIWSQGFAVPSDKSQASWFPCSQASMLLKADYHLWGVRRNNDSGILQEAKFTLEALLLMEIQGIFRHTLPTRRSCHITTLCLCALKEFRKDQTLRIVIFHCATRQLPQREKRDKSVFTSTLRVGWLFPIAFFNPFIRIATKFQSFRAICETFQASPTFDVTKDAAGHPRSSTLIVVAARFAGETQFWLQSIKIEYIRIRR